MFKPFISFKPFRLYQLFLKRCVALMHSILNVIGTVMLGAQKSFSTSDIQNYLTNKASETNNNGLRYAISDVVLNSAQHFGYTLEKSRLDQTFRSCSTWVAVGELASTSQLPSPHGYSISKCSMEPNIVYQNILARLKYET